ncbi:MAG: MerR family transcriptional regulator [Thermoleophilia bacterium]|nr:MerR family transcriptional regulator [Thermoleophilia bacterium]
MTAESGETFTIGQVVELLKEEFPTLSISKVRYLEDRGLLSPARTKGRYRKYSTEDVRRLRTILLLQRDEYLPLDVIKERLDRAAATLHGAQGFGASSPVVNLRMHGPLQREAATLSWEDLLRQTGASEAFLRSLVEFHLLEPGEHGGPQFTESDVAVVRICQALTRFGVEPRNLRLLVSSVERESALIVQLALPSLRSTHRDRREYGEQILADLGALYVELMNLLLHRQLRKAL